MARGGGVRFKALLQLAISDFLNQISLILICIASLVKIPCYLLKLSYGNENMGVSRADNSVKI